MRRFLYAGLVLAILETSVGTGAAQPPAPIDAVQLVRSWYVRFLGRAPNEEGMAGWIQAVRQGQAPEVVLSGILGSAEYYNRAGTTSEGFVRNLYGDLLGREPSRGEFEFAMNRLRRESPQEVAYQVLLRNPGSWRIPAPAPVAPPFGR